MKVLGLKNLELKQSAVVKSTVMSIKKRLAIFVLILLIFIALSSYIFVEVIIKSTLLEIERNLVEEQVKRVCVSIENDQKRLLGLTKDWAEWTDAWLFMRGKNPSFPKENLTVESFENNQLNLVAYLDADGNLKAGGYFIENQRKVKEVDETYVFQIFYFLMQNFDLTSPISHVGIHEFNGKPMFLAANSVLKSNKEGPVTGLLIMGRNLTDVYLENIASLLGLMELKIEVVEERLSISDKVEISENLKDIIIASFYTFDLFGKKRVHLTLLKQKQLWNLFSPKISELTLFYFCSIMLFVAAFIVFIRKNVIGKIDSIVHDIEEIERGNKKRLDLPKLSEFDFLVSSMNSLLTTIERQNSEILKTKEVCEIIAQNSDSIIVLVSRKEGLVFANKRVKGLLDNINNYYEFFESILQPDKYSKMSLNEFELFPSIFVSGLLTRLQDDSILFIGHDVTALRLERQRILDKVSKDTLTPLLSKTFFESSLRKIQVESDSNQPFTLIYVEIVNLNEISQNFGRDAAELIIRKVGNQIKEIIRHDDLACRWQSGEFLIASKDTVERVQSLTSRLGEKLESLSEETSLGEFSVRIRILFAKHERLRRIEQTIAEMKKGITS